MSRNKKLKYAYIYFIFNTPKIEFIIIDFKNEGTNKNLIAAWTIMYYKLQTYYVPDYQLVGGALM